MMARGDTRRADRVREGIREEIASYLMSGAKDPRVTGLVTVTGVDITPDLRYATVYVSILGTEDDGAAALEGLNAEAYRLKGEVGRALRLRLAPELTFKKDETAERVARIESLLAQVRQERPQEHPQEHPQERPPEPDGDTSGSDT